MNISINSLSSRSRTTSSYKSKHMTIIENLEEEEEDDDQKENNSFAVNRVISGSNINCSKLKFKVKEIKSAPNFLSRTIFSLKEESLKFRTNADDNNYNNFNKDSLKNYLFPNPNPNSNSENDNQDNINTNIFSNKMYEKSFIKRKTLTILTETSEELLNTFDQNLFFVTPKDINEKNKNKANPYAPFSLIQKNSEKSETKNNNSLLNLNIGNNSGSLFNSWQKSNAGRSTSNNKQKSRSIISQYEISLMSDRSACSKSTLRKAEEFLECLGNGSGNSNENLEERDNFYFNEKDNENEANTLGCYLITDQTCDGKANIKINAKKKWATEICVNNTESFNIVSTRSVAVSSNLAASKIKQVDHKMCNNNICSDRKLKQRQKAKARGIINNISISSLLKFLIFNIFLFFLFFLILVAFIQIFKIKSTNSKVSLFNNNNIICNNENIKIANSKDNNDIDISYSTSLPQYEFIFHKRLKEIDYFTSE